MTSTKIAPSGDSPTKYCKGCGKDLPATAEFFHINSRVKSGFQTYCRACLTSEVSPLAIAARRYKVAYRAKLRLEVLKAYGGLAPACACCGEGHIQFLTIDHVEGGGRMHRRKIGRQSGDGF